MILLEEKLLALKTYLGITDTTEDNRLALYLSDAKKEILNWLYSGNIPSTVTDVPTEYEPTQIQACIAGFNLIGAENQTAHNENGINRSFVYSDMVKYIRANVISYVEVR